jgi:magnesium transporter
MPSLPRSPFGRRSARAHAAAAQRAVESDEPRAEIVEAPGLRWINVERPRQVDLAWLAEHYEFHPLDYEDVISRNQRPKVDEYDDYLFIVLHFPRYDLLYKIVDDLVDASFPMLRKIGNKLERVEEEIFEGNSAEVVRDISNVKQEIINFRKIVRPQRSAFRDLERNKARYIADDLEIYFEDINDASERVWDMLENYKEVVEALEDTNESALAHRTNEIFRVLTAISVIVLPLTLVASIWGMNVGVPGEGDTSAFWAILVAMVVLLAGMVAYFRRRGWL